LAEKVAVRSSPPSQASVRLGLPYDFLYRSRAEQKRLLEERAAQVDRALAQST
jgi:hypothetical protein